MGRDREKKPAGAQRTEAPGALAPETTGRRKAGGLYDHPKLTVKLLNKVIIGGFVALTLTFIILLKTAGFVVRFDSRGGSDVPAQKLEYGDFVAEPAPPSREGYRFTGWYLEEDGREEWNFRERQVDNSMTLYAGWQKLAD